MIVISDTSPLSNLFLIGQLSILNDLFGEIIVPIAVWNELQALSDFGLDVSKIEEFIVIQIIAPVNISLVEQLEETLDEGESQSIALAQELQADMLLMDERNGTAIARSLGLKTIGILGILAEAKNRNLINKVRPVIIDLRNKAGFWLQKELEERFLSSIGE